MQIAARARERFDARGDVDSVAVNIAFAMHDVANVNANLYSTRRSAVTS